ncbi:MAG: MBL fold metallo-hydrolase [Oscillospiraceae bacterium]|nr:MBL fold metallo-hydrolase [Oscillospiraceae bacterium]
MKMVFIGAAHEVTGSCTYIEAAGKRFLVDFGMEQGRDVYENRQIPCAPSEIDFVLLTHAHIDHSGLLPLLYAGGFKGQIHATDATHSLCEIMLRDSAHIQEFEAEWRNRKARRSGKEAYVPLYTMNEALGAIECFVPHHYGEKIKIAEGIEVRFLDAGHLLGSSSIEVWLTEEGITRKLVFSGDIGNFNQPLIRDPQYAESADYVIMESTYGNRLHEKPKDYTAPFTEILLKTFRRGGSVIIPAFAVGRTQEMLYFLKKIKDAGSLEEFGNVPIYVDSPLAIEATEVFIKNKDSCFDKEAMEYVNRGENPIGAEGLITAVTNEASRAINFNSRPKIIISASGMCDAGRIKHHLKHNLWKPENTILFVGYQAEGSLGRKLLEGADHVTLFGEYVKVQAEIVSLPGMSGHADRNGLIKWIESIKEKPEKVFIVHGESSSADSYAELLKTQFGYDSIAPYSGAEFDMINEEYTSAEPLFVAKSANRKSSVTYDRLKVALDRITAFVQSSRGLSNKELAKMADQLTELCSKWER